MVKAKIQKPRILVTRFPFESRFGGEEVHTLTLMERLPFESFFLGSCPVLLEHFEGGKRKAWLGKPPVTKLWLVIFSVLSPVLFVLAGLYLFWARRRWKVNVLYCLSFGEKLLMTPWAKLFGMKVLWLEHARIGAWLTKNPWRVWYSLLSRFAEVVVTSNAMLAKLPFVKGVQAISCGVVLDKAEPLPAGLDAFVKGGDCVGTVARLTVDKGVDMMVRLVDTKPVRRVVIVGDGPLSGLVEGAVGENLWWEKNLSRGQLTSLYKALGVFVLSSTEFDPFGMVAAEAMLAGTPVVVTEQCGIAADLDGEAVVVPARVSAIAKGIEKASRMSGGRGRTFARKHYGLDRMVKEFEDLILA